MTSSAFSRGQWVALVCALALGLLVVLSLASLPDLWARTVTFALQMQRELHRDLAAALQAVRRSDAMAFWSLTLLGFLYGVFHAVGPGHGKVVIGTYLATHESRLERGIALSFLSSLLQGATAIVAVGVTAIVLERSMRQTQHTALALEAGSYALVALVGLFLIWRSGRRLFADRPSHPPASHGHGSGDGHGHACGHAHGPSAEDLEAPPSLRHFLVTVLSVGLRPCSGAILVLVLAASMDLLPAGVAAVVAMSIGTGITVAALAAASVYARRSALVLARTLADDHGRIRRALDLVGVAGGVLIVVFGVSLLRASLVVAEHPLL